jgi:hypothetical protein
MVDPPLLTQKLWWTLQLLQSKRILNFASADTEHNDNGWISKCAEKNLTPHLTKLKHIPGHYLYSYSTQNHPTSGRFHIVLVHCHQTRYQRYSRWGCWQKTCRIVSLVLFRQVLSFPVKINLFPSGCSQYAPFRLIGAELRTRRYD